MARRDRSRKSLKRPGPKREPYDRVLIVCEGEKTEPNYLKEMIAHFQLSSANVAIVGEGGAAPISVVELALEMFRKEPDYNSVFCVFDRDDHESFDRALQALELAKPLVRRAGKRKLGEARLDAITSIPCFEYWVLLHYQYTTAPMPLFADVERKLKRIPEHAAYTKGERGLFLCTFRNLEDALANAERANAEAARNGTDNPTTQLPGLIRYLQKLAEF